MPLTRAERRTHYDRFVSEITELCRDNGTRADLRTGRGRPPAQCPRMDRYLIARVRGFGAKHAHYTVASLIALTRPDPPPAPSPGPETAAPVPDSTTATAPPPAADTTAAPDPRQTAATWRARPTLGTTLAQAVRHHGFHHATTETSLYTLTKLSSDLLHPRLPGLTERLLTAGARPDFAVLLEDLTWWDDDREQITARWRETFYLTLDRTDLPTDREP